MPALQLFKIEHRGAQWIVTSEDGSKILGRHESKEEAEDQLRAIEASKARAAAKQEFHALFGDLQTLEVPRESDGKLRVGQWDRGMTPGTKYKDGVETTFSPETFGQMIQNWLKRGEKIALCYNHQSAYVSQNGQPAPALAFYNAVAVVHDGQLVQFEKLLASGATQPNIAELQSKVAGLATYENPKPSIDGCWFYRCEITEKGEELLANFAYLSPMFVPNGQDEQGNEIGYVLYDLAATNTAFQSGCMINFSAGGKADRQTFGSWVIAGIYDAQAMSIANDKPQPLEVTEAAAIIRGRGWNAKADAFVADPDQRKDIAKWFLGWLEEHEPHAVEDTDNAFRRAIKQSVTLDVRIESDSRGKSVVTASNANELEKIKLMLREGGFKGMDKGENVVLVDASPQDVGGALAVLNPIVNASKWEAKKAQTMASRDSQESRAQSAASEGGARDGMYTVVFRLKSSPNNYHWRWSSTPDAAGDDAHIEVVKVFGPTRKKPVAPQVKWEGQTMANVGDKYTSRDGDFVVVEKPKDGYVKLRRERDGWEHTAPEALLTSPGWKKLEAQTMAQYGTCPRCGMGVALGSGGTLTSHGQFGRRCPGSGGDPVSKSPEEQKSPRGQTKLPGFDAAKMALDELPNGLRKDDEVEFDLNGQRREGVLTGYMGAGKIEIRTSSGKYYIDPSKVRKMEKFQAKKPSVPVSQGVILMDGHGLWGPRGAGYVVQKISGNQVVIGTGKKIDLSDAMRATSIIHQSKK